MHAVRFRLGAALTALALTTLCLVALAWPAQASTGSIASRAASSGKGAVSTEAAVSGAAAGSGIAAPSGCHEVFQPPSTWVVVCTSPGGPGGSSGGGGGGGKVACTLQPLSPAQIHFLGLPKAPQGEQWAAVTCPGKQPFGGVTLVSKKTGVPRITPRELAQYARGLLHIPATAPATAPPLTRRGLVGLPEWYWIPHGWGPVRSPRVTAGPVWAQVTATPILLSFDPGGGLAGSSCHGPGTAYAAGRHTACSYTYQQSSATQPGGRYQAQVVVTWRVTWAGGIGAATTDGGTLSAGLARAYGFALRVAEGQALVTRTGVSNGVSK